MSCSNCVYFKPEPPEASRGVGICRRFPPSPISNGEDWGVMYLPVKLTDWCGEWDLEFDEVVVDPLGNEIN